MREPKWGRGAAAVAAVVASMLVIGNGGEALAAVPTPPDSAQFISRPGTPAPTVSVDGGAFSRDRARALQDAVDGGSQPWRLDPIAVARAFVEGVPGWGGARLVPTGPATVEATAPGHRDAMLLRLGQPATVGPTGVWVVQDVRPS